MKLIQREADKFIKRIYGRKVDTAEAQLMRRAFLGGINCCMVLVLEAKDDETRVKRFLQLQQELKQEVARMTGTTIAVEGGQMTATPLPWYKQVWQWLRG